MKNICTEIDRLVVTVMHFVSFHIIRSKNAIIYRYFILVWPRQPASSTTVSYRWRKLAAKHRI